jgi:muramoyltetrapeptide carboxypeptidase
VASGEAEGHVVGGNLDTFVHLIGTPYLPDVDGAILFIEDVHKTGLVLDREMLHLRLAGILDRISGVVIGEFAEVPNTDDVRTPAPEDVVIEYFANGVPCVYGYSFSHGDYTSPIPIGAMCRINADTGIVSFDDFSMRP